MQPTKQNQVEGALGKSLGSLLDITTWRQGHDLNGLYERLQAEVEAGAAQSQRTREPLRRLVQSRLEQGAASGTFPSCAGLYHVTPDDIARVHRSLLFNGAAECCDGTVIAHDGLLLTVAQIGVSLVRYQGASGTWMQRMYRRDLRQGYADPTEEALALLDARSRRRESANDTASYDETTRLMRRGLMEYAERAALLHHSQAAWRIGHGNPVPLTLLMLTSPQIFEASLDVLRSLLLGHRKWVYVTSEPSDRVARTIGDVLEPLEYAVMGGIGDTVETAGLTRGQGSLRFRDRLQNFLEETLPQIVYGVYRAAAHAPAQVFYAHRDHVHVAAALALADSVLQPLRGFPMLIDIADLTCRSAFDAASFAGTVSGVYAGAGYPVQYLGERETRHG